MKRTAQRKLAETTVVIDKEKPTQVCCFYLQFMCLIFEKIGLRYRLLFAQKSLSYCPAAWNVITSITAILKRFPEKSHLTLVVLIALGDKSIKTLEALRQSGNALTRGQIGPLLSLFTDTMVCHCLSCRRNAEGRHEHRQKATKTRKRYSILVRRQSRR